MIAQVISAQADMCAAHVKPRSGGHSQNYMPPEAKDALEKVQKSQAMGQGGMPPAVK